MKYIWIMYDYQLVFIDGDVNQSFKNIMKSTHSFNPLYVYCVLLDQPQNYQT